MHIFRLIILLVLCLAWSVPAAQAQSILSNTPYQTEVIVLGNGQAPAVMVIGGVHGNEPAGSLAAQQLTNKSVTQGTLIIIPQVNKLALEKGIRTLDTIGDINRQYNAQSSQMPSKQIANEIIALMQQYKISMLIDLHEARDYNKLNKASLGQLVLPTMNDRSAMLALDVVEHVNKRIETGYEKFAYGPYPIPDSAAYYAGKQLGIAAFTIETSSKNSLEERVRQHVAIAEYLITAEGVVYK